MWSGASRAPPSESRAARVLSFKLNGKALLPPPAVAQHDLPEPPPMTASAEVAQRGKTLYHAYCARCHHADVLDNGFTPDLRRVGATAT